MLTFKLTTKGLPYSFVMVAMSLLLGSRYVALTFGAEITVSALFITTFVVVLVAL